jgi:SET domain-containing protein
MRHRLCELKKSAIHGSGVFARVPLEEGARIVEYKGERVSREIADRRYERKLRYSTHTFLFTVDDDTVIDGGKFGNIARYINHSCEPNCESVIDEDGRVYIDAVRDIATGEELTMDYRLQVDSADPAEWRELYACRCGSPGCRRTMVWFEAEA